MLGIDDEDPSGCDHDVIDVALSSRYAAVMEELDVFDARQGFGQFLLSDRASFPCSRRLRVVGDRQDHTSQDFSEAAFDSIFSSYMTTLILLVS